MNESQLLAEYEALDYKLAQLSCLASSVATADHNHRCYTGAVQAIADLCDKLYCEHSAYRDILASALAKMARADTSPNK